MLCFDHVGASRGSPVSARMTRVSEFGPYDDRGECCSRVAIR